MHKGRYDLHLSMSFAFQRARIIPVNSGVIATTLNRLKVLPQARGTMTFIIVIAGYCVRVNMDMAGDVNNYGGKCK